MSNINVGKVAMVPLSSIEVGDRARKEMGDLGEIETSIKERGLISPLAVKEISDGRFFLLAGERRYLVLSKNNVEQVPIRVYPSDITDIEMKSIELEENLKRKGFEWWEEDNLIREIHELQQSIHGTKAPGPDQQGWGMDETSGLLNVTKPTVSTAIQRAKARDEFPGLFDGCKTKADASKVMKKMTEAVVKENLAEKIKSNPNTSISQISKSFIINDFFTGVKDIPDGMFHLVEIDPPYAIKLQDAKKKDGESQYAEHDYNEVDTREYERFMFETFKQCYRVMAEHSWLICWFAPEPWFENIYLQLVEAGFQTTRLCGIWTKHSGQSKRPEIHLANSYEMFFYAWKGRPALNKQGRINEFNIPPVAAQNKTHPTERPVELMAELYTTFAFPGSRILIPFLGSGNGLIAAHETGMSAIGFEKSKGYKDSFLVKFNNQFVK